MSLTTTELEGDEIEFCITAVAPNAAESAEPVFAVYWTDGELYVDDGETETATDGLWFRYTVETEAVLILDYNTGSSDTTNDWTNVDDKTDYSCDEYDTCTIVLCATRALVTEDEDDFDLPFKDGFSMNAQFSAGDFSGYVYCDALSLGLALFAAAGATLSLI